MVFQSKDFTFAACYLIYRDLILCNVLYIYTSVINCTLVRKRISFGLTPTGTKLPVHVDLPVLGTPELVVADAAVGVVLKVQLLSCCWRRKAPAAAREGFAACPCRRL